MISSSLRLLVASAGLLLSAGFVCAQEEASEDAFAGTRRVSDVEVEAAKKKAAVLLIDMQESLDRREEPDEWPYQGVYRVGGRIPIGYRVGGTAITGMALLDSKQWKLDEDLRGAVLRGLDFVLEKLDEPLMASSFKLKYDVRGWGHCYALLYLLKLRDKGLVPENKGEAVDARITWLVETLQATEIPVNGGWNYSRPGGLKRGSAPSIFMTAPILQALFEARRQGEVVDAAVVERGLKMLEFGRLETGAFQYSASKTKTGKGFEALPGAIARMPIAETTLLLAGRGSVDRVRSSLDAFFEHWVWLDKRRAQTDTHIKPYYIAPYYFYYAHYYAAQAIERLPEAERQGYRDKLYSLLWKVRLESGGWNDRVFSRSENFGTAMSLLALNEPGGWAPATWVPDEGEAAVKEDAHGKGE